MQHDSTSSARLATIVRSTTFEGLEYLVEATACPWQPTEVLVLRAWRETVRLIGHYGTVSTIDGKRVGLVGSSRGDGRYEVFPLRSKQRREAYDQVALEQSNLAQNVICAAFPEIDAMEYGSRLPVSAMRPAYDMSFKVR